MAGTVALERDGAVATIRLERPERLNAINAALLADLAAAFDQASDAGTAVIVVHGAGRAFCAGDDLTELDEQGGDEADTRRFVEAIQDVTRRILATDAIVIAAVHGWAVGGGVEWMLGCDLALMADDAAFFFPEIELGLFPTGGTSVLLPARVGRAKARELLLLGERHGADAALALGLVNRVVAPDELLPTAYRWAERIAALPAAARRNAKHLLASPGAAELEAAMARETEAVVAGLLDPATAERAGGRLGRA